MIKTPLTKATQARENQRWDWSTLIFKQQIPTFRAAGPPFSRGPAQKPVPIRLQGNIGSLQQDKQPVPGLQEKDIRYVNTRTKSRCIRKGHSGQVLQGQKACMVEPVRTEPVS